MINPLSASALPLIYLIVCHIEGFCGGATTPILAITPPNKMSTPQKKFSTPPPIFGIIKNN
jgi:hypothetical protein